MLIGLDACILCGYTGADHLIDEDDSTRVTSAVAGVSFRRASDAVDAAYAAYVSGCDRRVKGAHIRVRLRNAHGDIISLR